MHQTAAAGCCHIAASALGADSPSFGMPSPGMCLWMVICGCCLDRVCARLGIPYANLQRYGRKAMRSAYDTISNAAEHAPGLVSQPQLAQVH